MTIGQWRARSLDLGLPVSDVTWIEEEALGIPRSRLSLERDRVLEKDELLRLNGARERYQSGEPLQYIFSRAPFMGFEFFVNKEVLIPRMDTEVLCEEALLFLKTRDHPRVLDLCAGSGAIGLSLKRLCPASSVVLSDISPGAVGVQRINASEDSSVEILLGNLFDTVPGRRFDAIVCNPPYIPTGDIAGLDPFVRKEPFLALDGGEDGLRFYRAIAGEYRRHLLHGGRLFLEIGADQAESVSSLFPGSTVKRDLNGLPRVVVTGIFSD